MKIIPNWRNALRMFSVQAQGIQLAGIAAWQLLPDEWRAAVPTEALMGLAATFLVLGIVGRLIAQPGIEAPK